MRIVIAEDSVLLRAGLTRLLSDAGEEVVAAVGDGEALVETVERHQPDLAIVDVRMPPSFTDEGLRAAITIRERWPDVAVLVLSQYVEERYAADLLAGQTHGVGYLLKDRVADVSEFLSAVRRVGEGGTALDPEVVAQILARTRRRDLEVYVKMTSRPHGRGPVQRRDRRVCSCASAVEKHEQHLRCSTYRRRADHRRVWRS
jgi:DNA-binding NarL/FixJ family response regulator